MLESAVSVVNAFSRDMIFHGAITYIVEINACKDNPCGCPYELAARHIRSVFESINNTKHDCGRVGNGRCTDGM